MATGDGAGAGALVGATRSLPQVGIRSTRSIEMNIATYLSEAKYALTAPYNWRSRIALLIGTLRFHCSNGFGQQLRGSESILVDLAIGATRRSVRLRPYSGDLFILYEVLAFDAYALPNEEIEPNSVRFIVDCGANIGITALLFAARYPNAQIISIEPDPANYKLLCENVASEPRVIPLQAAVVGTPCSSIALSQDRPAWGNAVVAGHNAKGVNVAAVTLEQIIADHNLPYIDLLKIDIEGAEKDVFSAPAFMDRVGYLVIELHGDYSLDRLQADIAPLGFTARPPQGQTPPHSVTAVRSGECSVR